MLSPRQIIDQVQKSGGWFRLSEGCRIIVVGFTVSPELTHAIHQVYDKLVIELGGQPESKRRWQFERGNDHHLVTQVRLPRAKPPRAKLPQSAYEKRFKTMRRSITEKRLLRDHNALKGMQRRSDELAANTPLRLNGHSSLLARGRLRLTKQQLDSMEHQRYELYKYALGPAENNGSWPRTSSLNADLPCAGEKRCTTCKEVLSVLCFSAHPQTHSGLNSQCRQCVSTHQAALPRSEPNNYSMWRSVENRWA